MADPGGSGEIDDFGDLSGRDASGERLDDELERHRTATIERLKRHAGPGGALTSEALADRVRRVSLAQTRVGIDQVLADLPADPPWAVPGLPPPPGQVPVVRLRRRASPGRTVALVLGALALLVSVAGVLVADASRDDNDDGESASEAPAPERPASTLPPLDVPEEPATTAPPATEVPTLPADLGSFPPVEREFVLLKVGEDIPAGRYLSTGGSLCYWERVHGFGGTLADVIVNGSGDPTSDHVIVDVLPSDAGLRAQGCDFRLYTPPATPATTITDGDWLVGSDVAAGTYRLTEGTSELTGDASMCAWERSTNFTHDYDGIIDYAYPAGDRLTVELGAGERFTSIMCGTWSLV